MCYLFWVRAFSLIYPARKERARCYIVIYDLFCSTIFSCISLIRRNFWKTFLSIKYIYFLYNYYLKYFLCWEQFNGILSKCTYVFMYTVFLSDLNETWIISTDFRDMSRSQISWKSVQWDPSFFMRTDRQKDVMNLIVAYRNFAQEPRNISPRLTWPVLCVCVSFQNPS
jgi:hypothetical protein